MFADQALRGAAWFEGRLLEKGTAPACSTSRSLSSKTCSWSHRTAANWNGRWTVMLFPPASPDAFCLVFAYKDVTRWEDVQITSDLCNEFCHSVYISDNIKKTTAVDKCHLSVNVCQWSILQLPFKHDLCVSKYLPHLDCGQNDLHSLMRLDKRLQARPLKYVKFELESHIFCVNFMYPYTE